MKHHLLKSLFLFVLIFLIPSCSNPNKDETVIYGKWNAYSKNELIFTTEFQNNGKAVALASKKIEEATFIVNYSKKPYRIDYVSKESGNFSHIFQIVNDNILYVQTDNKNEIDHTSSDFLIFVRDSENSDKLAEEEFKKLGIIN